MSVLPLDDDHLFSRKQTMTTATQIGDAVRRRASAAQSEFDRLAIAVADNTQLNPDDVAEVLHRLERSAEDLATVAELILQRRLWAVEMSKGPLLDIEQARLADIAAELERRFKADILRLKTDFQLAMDSNTVAARSVDGDRGRAATARNRLIDTSRQFAELKRLWAAIGPLAQALQNDLPHELRHDSPTNRANTQLRINATVTKKEAIETAIRSLEQQALLP